MIIDAIVLTVLLISALIAFFRGFIRETLTILGVAGGLAVSYYGAPHLEPHMSGWLGVDPEADPPQELFGVVPYTIVSTVLSYGSIFVIVVIVLSLISHLLAESVKKLGLGAVDRSLGVVFGLVRGVFLIGVLYMPLHLYYQSNPDEKDAVFEQSRSHVYMEMTAGWLLTFFPDNLKERFKEHEGDLETVIDSPALNNTRKALESQGLLPQSENSDKAEEQVDVPNKQNGYTPEFRKKMDELFKQETQSQE